MALKLRIKKISGNTDDPEEKFVFIDDSTKEAVNNPCSSEELWQFFTGVTRQKYDSDIKRARQQYDQTHGSDLHLLADSGFEVNLKAKPKIK